MLADMTSSRRLRGSREAMSLCSGERRAIPRTTNQTNLSRELETSTALPTRRTQPPNAYL